MTFEGEMLKDGQPSRATEIIAALLPPEMTFYRTPITSPDSPKPKRATTPNDINTPDLQATIQPSEKAEFVPIYGSVSTADIADAVGAAISMDEEGKRVVLGAEDISIVRERATEYGMEPGKIKALGKFTVAVRVKGGTLVRRTVNVKARSSNE